MRFWAEATPSPAAVSRKQLVPDLRGARLAVRSTVRRGVGAAASHAVMNAPPSRTDFSQPEPNRMEWLIWARKIHALAQNGLTYTEGKFDRERYTQLQELAAEILAMHGGEEKERVLGLFRRENGYMTPKVDVRGAVFHEGELLLVREREDGGWTLPGGWADVGESPSEAVIKEIREESGYETRAAKLLAVWDRDRHGHPPLAWYVYKLVFRCEVIGGAPADSIETQGARFFPEDAIPDLSRSRVVESQIRRLFEHLRDPDLPTDFD